MVTHLLVENRLQFLLPPQVLNLFYAPALDPDKKWLEMKNVDMSKTKLLVTSSSERVAAFSSLLVSRKAYKKTATLAVNFIHAAVAFLNTLKKNSADIQNALHRNSFGCLCRGTGG